MRIRLGLLTVFWRQALPATLVGTIALSLYALLRGEVLSCGDMWPGAIVLAHSLLLTALLGRFQSTSFAFVYSRGYSRDSLWSHMMLASLLSVATAFALSGLVLWSGLRSYVHDHIFQSPCFPIMAPRETWVPLVWLALYGLFVPCLHYAWIRCAQPTTGEKTGQFLAAGTLAALLTAFVLIRYLSGWMAWLCGTLYVVFVLSNVIGGWLLHRSLEVRA